MLELSGDQEEAGGKMASGLYLALRSLSALVPLREKTKVFSRGGGGVENIIWFRSQCGSERNLRRISVFGLFVLLLLFPRLASVRTGL